MRKISTVQIGDGKLPNKYWVSISNDYLYLNQDEDVWDWISDLKLFECKGKTIAVFSTFEEALNFARELPYQTEFDGIFLNSWHIEDRLSGQVYERVRMFNPVTATTHTMEQDDTKYTKNTLEAKNIKFI